MINQRIVDRTRVLSSVAALLVPAGLVACGGGGGGAASPPPPGPPPPPPPPIITMLEVPLAADQVVDGSSETGSGTATVTYDETADEIQVDLTLTDVTADTVTVYAGFAGEIGTELFSLAPGTDVGSWVLAAASLQTDHVADLEAGGLYLRVTVAGEATPVLRGQVLLPGFELVITELDGDAVVLGGNANLAQTTIATLMTTIGPSSLTAHLNVATPDDVTSVTLHQAPAGQNGPALVSLTVDPNNDRHWFVEDLAIDAGIQAGLDNRSIYALAINAANTDGIARGQVETASSMDPPDTSVFTVAMIDPPDAATLDALPQTVFVTLSREPLAASVTPMSVFVELSGNDGSFGDGNESLVSPSSTSVAGNVIQIGLAGALAVEDVYRTVIRGGGANGVLDMAGLALDGDSDGEGGGDFEATFELDLPQLTATLSSIQDFVFTPTCAVSGCHSGANAPDGLNLEQGNAFANIVDVPSVQSPALDRIEPGNPDDSYLVRKLEGSGIQANQMPLGQAPLSNDVIAIIRQWVSDGAANN